MSQSELKGCVPLSFGAPKTERPLFDFEEGARGGIMYANSRKTIAVSIKNLLSHLQNSADISYAAQENGERSSVMGGGSSIP